VDANGGIQKVRVEPATRVRLPLVTLLVRKGKIVPRNYTPGKDTWMR